MATRELITVLGALALTFALCVAAPATSKDRTVSAAELLLRSSTLSPNAVAIMDELYYAPSTNDWKLYLPNITRKYVPDRYDCDEFAIESWAFARRVHAETSELKAGIAIGVIGFITPEGIGHACNIILLSNGEFIIWDPQSRETRPVPKTAIFIWW